MGRTIVLAVIALIALVLVPRGQAEVAAKCEGGERGRILQIVLAHAPKMVRTGADLYSLRLELIHAFFSKTEYDDDTGKLVEKMAKGVEKLGLEAVGMIAAIREELPHKKLWKALRRGKGKGTPGGKPRRWGPWKARAKMHQRLAKRVREVMRGLALTEQQRFDIKLVALAWTPTLVRSLGLAVSEGIGIAQHVLGKDFDRRACTASVRKLSEHVKSIVEGSVKLAFAIREKLTKQQIRRLLANLPLRILFLR